MRKENNWVQPRELWCRHPGAGGAAVKSSTGNQRASPLVDKDPVALRLDDRKPWRAQEGQVGEQRSCSGATCSIRWCVTKTRLLELGEQQAELVDALGIFEYFNDVPTVIFSSARCSWSNPAGGNCQTCSPAARKIDFVLPVSAGEDIYPRSLQQLQDVHPRRRAGGKCYRGVVPKDGVYAVMGD